MLRRLDDVQRASLVPGDEAELEMKTQLGRAAVAALEARAKELVTGNAAAARDVFRPGWTTVWRACEQDFAPLPAAVSDAADFARAAAGHAANVAANSCAARDSAQRSQRDGGEDRVEAWSIDDFLRFCGGREAYFRYLARRKFR